MILYISKQYVSRRVLQWLMIIFKNSYTFIILQSINKKKKKKTHAPLAQTYIHCHLLAKPTIIPQFLRTPHHPSSSHISISNAHRVHTRRSYIRVYIDIIYSYAPHGKIPQKRIHTLQDIRRKRGTRVLRKEVRRGRGALPACSCAPRRRARSSCPESLLP